MANVLGNFRWRPVVLVCAVAASMVTFGGARPAPSGQPRPDGSVGPRAADDDVALSGGGSTAPLIRLAAGPAELAPHWPGELRKPVLSGNAATYPEVLPGVDLVMRAETSSAA